MSHAGDQAILRIAGRVARLGGWQVEADDLHVTWSDETAAIHDEPPGFSPSLDEGLAYYAPEHRAGVRLAVDDCLARGLPFDLQLELITARGRRVWVRAIGEPERDGKGQIVRIQGALQDVTQQRADAERIQTLAGGLLETLELLPDGFVTLDRSWRFRFVNAAAERVLKRPRAALVGRSAWEVYPEYAGTDAQAALDRAVETGQPMRLERHFPRLGRWLEVEAQPTREGIVIHLRDVTERRRHLDAIRDQATLLDKAKDAILVRDLEHRIVYWNRSAERLYGWTAAEALGRRIDELLYVDPTAFRIATSATVEKGEWVGELEQITKDRQNLVVEGHWTLVRDEKGSPRTILAINTDITRRKQLEAQFLRAQRMESIGALAGGIAHDLNNALAPIVLSASTLRDTEPDVERREELAVIEGSAQRAADMVRQLLAFARGTDARRTSVDVGAIVAEVRKIASDTFPKNIELETHVASGLWRVAAHPTQIQQLLTNLCVNARDAMPNGGRLCIAAEHVVVDDVYAEMHLDAKAGPHVRLSVEDTGTGMEPAVLDRIFEPFFTTKEVGRGTGLGLSTVHAIVRNHGGFVGVRSEVGRGSRFEVHLPATVAETWVDEAPVETAAPRIGKGELVLVVDDEEPIRVVTRRLLERAGYRVLTASNGAEAVATYAQHIREIAVVLVDMKMPVMDGPATVVALRSLDGNARIIGSSGNLHEAPPGLASFVAKPYTAETLLALLRDTLDA